MEKKFNTGHLLTLIGMAIGFTVTCVRFSYASGADATRMVQMEKAIAILQTTLANHEQQLIEMKADFSKAQFSFGRDLKELRDSAIRQEAATERQNATTDAIRNEQLRLAEALRIPARPHE